MSDSVPVAVVGVSWRSASTHVRARLASLSGTADPVAPLRASGYVSGAVRVATCSRTEWILTADQAAWAASLFQGALLTHVPGLAAANLSVRSGGAALHYLLRVAVGLDSVAEGEGAVGRQVLKSFETARSAGLTDRRMRQVWKQVERLVHVRRDTVPQAQSRGVQSLVRDVLTGQPVTAVAILGKGEFGLAMERSLRGAGRWAVSTFSRASMADFLEQAERGATVVVCTGGSEPWLQLPHREGALCIDAGSPPQVKGAPGWTLVGLDQLLERPDLQLAEPERLRLESVVLDATRTLTHSLAAPSPSQALAAIDAERSQFLNQELPALLAGLPKDQVRRVRQAVGAFTHTLIQKTREVSR